MEVNECDLFLSLNTGLVESVIDWLQGNQKRKKKKRKEKTTPNKRERRNVPHVSKTASKSCKM